MITSTQILTSNLGPNPNHNLQIKYPQTNITCTFLFPFLTDLFPVKQSVAIMYLLWYQNIVQLLQHAYYNLKVIINLGQ